MPFVTISVLAQDSTLLTGAITDDDGKYEIEVNNPKYIIQASYVGYQTAFGGPDFVLREETERLAELEVKAKKPLVERQMDKLVVNVSASPLSAGSNGNDILRRAPGVRIDKDGNILGITDKFDIDTHDSDYIFRADGNKLTLGF